MCRRTIEATRLYRLAADQGNAHAQGNLGALCALGRGMTKYFGEAVRYFRLAAEQGDVPSQFKLGVLLGAAAAGRALPATPGEAARFLAQAAQQTGDEETRLEALAELREYAQSRGAR
mmetsp:Transcript_31052/g.77654  ORF Transcript_31052/g.77654 Transcript_31052/m.77654 type:complete len:118 (+) Transcript_31052:292-645(+)